MSTPLTAAQAAQQNNRDAGGRYATKQHAEADVALEGQADVFQIGDDDIVATAQRVPAEHLGAAVFALHLGEKSGWGREGSQLPLEGDDHAETGDGELSLRSVSRSESTGTWHVPYSRWGVSETEGVSYRVSDGRYTDDTVATADEKFWLRGKVTDGFAGDVFDGDTAQAREFFAEVELDYQRARAIQSGPDSQVLVSDYDGDFSGGRWRPIPERELHGPAKDMADRAMFYVASPDGDQDSGWYLDSEASYDAAQEIVEASDSGGGGSWSFDSYAMATSVSERLGDHGRSGVSQRQDLEGKDYWEVEFEPDEDQDPYGEYRRNL